jgi:hypothetical protein
MSKWVKLSLLSLVLVTFLAVSSDVFSYIAGDLDGNHSVNIQDLRIFAWQWLDPDCLEPGCTADLDEADGVNMVDFALLAANWQEMRTSIVISEFMAINETTFSTTVEGKEVYSDWIEIYNTSAEQVNLSGWYLTDEVNEPAKWEFPNVSIASHEFLLVFASDIRHEDHPGNYPYIDEDGHYHTNFKLDGDGDYLALVGPGLEVVHEYKSYEYSRNNFGFPPQEEDISYGLYLNEQLNDQRYFSPPTPEFGNNQGFVGVSETLLFSPEGGTFVDPISLRLMVQYRRKRQHNISLPSPSVIQPRYRLVCLSRARRLVLL